MEQILTEKTISKKSTIFRRMIYVVLSILMLLDIFFSVPFTFAGFRFEWAFFLIPFILIDMISKKKKNRTFSAPAAWWLFIGFCTVLAVLSFLRFEPDFAFVGFAHFGRMILLFLPFIWIIDYLDNEERREFLAIFRVAVIIAVIWLLVPAIQDDFAATGDRYRTEGVGKNSLGYTIVLFQLFFFCFEKKEYTKRPIPFYIWFPICAFLAFVTKSGTAITFTGALLVICLLLNEKLSLAIKMLLLIVFLFTVFIAVSNPVQTIAFFDELKIKKISDLLKSLFYENSLDRNNQARFDVQILVFQQFDLKIALGRFYYIYFAEYGATAHQQYFQILYDTGIIGLALFLNFAIKCIREGGYKVAVVTLFMYSFIENFLVQYVSLITLALFVVGATMKQVEQPEDGTAEREK